MSIPPLANRDHLKALFDASTDEDDVFWMFHARLLATWSTDPALRSGAVAVSSSSAGTPLCSSSDRLPPLVRDFKARRRDKWNRSMLHLSAPVAMICLAASRGISLEGSTCYIWPAIDGAQSVSLLVSAGCRTIVDLDLPEPEVMAAEMHLARQVMAESGTTHRKLRLSIASPRLAVTFGGQSESHGPQAPPIP